MKGRHRAPNRLAPPKGRHRAPSRRRFVGATALAVVALAAVEVVLQPRIAGLMEGGGEPDIAAAASMAPTGPPDRAETPVASPPSPSVAPTPGRGTLVIHGTGDVNLDPSYIPALQTYGYGHAWSGLRGLFRRDDLTVVNLECPVSNLPGIPMLSEFVFRGDPAALPAMRRAGVEVVNLGNNHSLNLGVDVMLDTRVNLLARGIQPVGAGKHLGEATKPALFELRGWTVAVVGFGGVVPSGSCLAGPDSPGMASGDDIPTMVRAVRRASRSADLVVVTIHWGAELDTGPRPEDVERAHAMVDAGADGHPVLQGS